MHASFAAARLPDIGVSGRSLGGRLTFVSSSAELLGHRRRLDVPVGKPPSTTTRRMRQNR